MSVATQIRSYTYDSTQVLKVSAAVTASAAGSLIIPVGAAAFRGVAVVDVSAIDVSSADEIYDIVVQGSDSATFASGIENLCQLNLGAAATRDGGAQVSTVGRYELPFINEQNGSTYAYLRIYTKCAGTTPSITYSAVIGLDRLGC